MADVILHGVARAVLTDGEYGIITLYDEDDRVLGTITEKASFGLEDIKLEQG